MFSKLKIPLKCFLSLIGQFKTLESFKKYLASANSKDRDILICYDWPSLFDPALNDHWGHVCVLDKVDIEKEEIRMIDPSPNSAKWVTVKIVDLYRAMQVHGDKNSGGFWELSLL